MNLIVPIKDKIQYLLDLHNSISPSIIVTVIFRVQSCVLYLKKSYYSYLSYFIIYFIIIYLLGYPYVVCFVIYVTWLLGFINKVLYLCLSIEIICFL